MQQFIPLANVIFSKHALEQMAYRNFSEGDVEHVLGTRYAHIDNTGKARIYGYVSDGREIRISLERRRSQGRIIWFVFTVAHRNAMYIENGTVSAAC